MEPSPRTIYLYVRQLQKLLEAEREGPFEVDVPVATRLWCWRRGFLSRSAILYDFAANDWTDYLTDYQRFVRTRDINGSFGIILDNKLLFHQQLATYDEHRPTLWGLLSNGRLSPLPSTPADGPANTRPAVAWLEDRLGVDDRLVLKWVRGGGGENVLIVGRDDDAFLVNGETRSSDAFRAQLQELDQYVVTSFVDQADYAASMFPDSTNTIRAITMWDETTDEPFLARAIHRIGVPSSAPLDNFDRGGLSASIDLETGELGPGARLAPEGVSWHAAHPETGAAIEGRVVPHWDTIAERLRTIAASLPHLSYAGWDLVVTGQGTFEIIEANNYPGMKSLQVHGPLLTDARIRGFYRAHGVLGG